MEDTGSEEKYFGEHAEYFNEERTNEDCALFVLKLREVASIEYGYNHIHKLTDFEASKALIEREYSIRNNLIARFKVIIEALKISTDQLDSMNTSPMHASSWVEPRSHTTTKRVLLNREALLLMEQP
jgi:hypothetical protein